MPTAKPTRASISRFSVAAVITGFVAIVLLPPLTAYVPMEVAKWYLAAAQQALDGADKPGDAQVLEAERLLRRAEKLNPAIVDTADYIRIRLTARPEEVWPELLSKIRELDPQRRNAVVLGHAGLRSQLRQFEAALALIESIYPLPSDRDADLNNLFAYAAAEGNTRLDEAVESIELALEDSQNSAYLDTQAWVLFRRGRQEEALPVMQRAIRERYREQRENLERLSEYPVAASILKQLDRVRDEDVLSRYTPPQLLELLLVGEVDAGRPDDGPDSPQDDKRGDEGDGPAADGLPIPDTVSKLADALASNVPAAEAISGGEQFQQIFEQLAVFRYHRAEIIRELGRPDLAALEFEYLRAHGIEDPATLH